MIGTELFWAKAGKWLMGMVLFAAVLTLGWTGVGEYQESNAELGWEALQTSQELIVARNVALKGAQDLIPDSVSTPADSAAFDSAVTVYNEAGQVYLDWYNDLRERAGIEE